MRALRTTLETTAQLLVGLPPDTAHLLASLPQGAAHTACKCRYSPNCLPLPLSQEKNVYCPPTGAACLPLHCPCCPPDWRTLLPLLPSNWADVLRALPLDWAERLASLPPGWMDTMRDMPPGTQQAWPGTMHYQVSGSAGGGTQT